MHVVAVVLTTTALTVQLAPVPLVSLEPAWHSHQSPPYMHTCTCNHTISYIIYSSHYSIKNSEKVVICTCGKWYAVSGSEGVSVVHHVATLTHVHMHLPA